MIVVGERNPRRPRVYVLTHDDLARTLRELVDVTWQDAKEDEQVPGTPEAHALIMKAVRQAARIPASELPGLEADLAADLERLWPTPTKES